MQWLLVEFKTDVYAFLNIIINKVKPTIPNMERIESQDVPGSMIPFALFQYSWVLGSMEEKPIPHKGLDLNSEILFIHFAVREVNVPPILTLSACFFSSPAMASLQTGYVIANKTIVVKMILIK